MNTNTINFSKLRNVKSPIRGTSVAAGIDFYIPEDLTAKELIEAYTKLGLILEENININIDNDYVSSIIVLPGGNLFIPSGIKVKLNHNTCLIFSNKSGVASKTGLLVGASVIDEDYEGVVHFNLWNVSNKETTIKAGQKIVQGIIYPIQLSMPSEVPLDTLYINSLSERKEGGFGSTGLN